MQRDPSLAVSGARLSQPQQVAICKRDLETSNALQGSNALRLGQPRSGPAHAARCTLHASRIVPVAVLLVILAAYSIYLARHRIYQVDECQNLFMASVLAKGQAAEFFTNASLFLLGPLSWMAQKCSHAADYFSSARLLFLGVFWINILLLAKIAGGRLRSAKGLLALAGAATLAPLWDYGFEIRHDNLVLTGLLLIWWLVQRGDMRLLCYGLAGAVSIALLFIAVKSVVYVIPLALAILLFPPPVAAELTRLKLSGITSFRASLPGLLRLRWPLLAAWVAGTLVALCGIRLCYGTGGKWQLYLSVFHGVAKYSAGGGGGSARFWPWFALSLLLPQIPLILALSTAACLAWTSQICRQRQKTLARSGNVPELLLFAGALAALFVNPSPFPYNVVLLVPFAFLVAFKYSAELWDRLRTRPNLVPLAISIVLFVHFLPFATATLRHLDHRNDRQRMLMNLAESMTDSAHDPVYDGIGLVPTRPSVHYLWYLHSLNMESFISGPGPKVRDMLREKPAAVLIPNYRTDWLPEEDHDFFQAHYVPLADDFRVLGQTLPAGGGNFEVVHPGRYWVSSAETPNTEPDLFAPSKTNAPPPSRLQFAVTLDGSPLSNQAVELTAGLHQLGTATNGCVSVRWLGPILPALPQLGDSSHRSLFVNWY